MENTLVVKIGGGEGVDMIRACADLAQSARRRPLVVVHGVSARMNQMCADLGVSVRTLQSPSGHSSRYTDPRTRDIFVAAARSVNHELVEYLRSYGINAVGLTHDSQCVVHGERKDALRAIVDGRVKIIRDDYSGTISHADGERINQLLEQGIVPVIPPYAVSADGFLNVDGDRASAAVAASLGAEELIILSNVRGLYSAFPDENSFVANVGRQQMESAMDWAQGRMKRKVLGAQEALSGGVQRVIIGDGRTSSPVTQALSGAGTVFTAW